MVEDMSHWLRLLLVTEAAVVVAALGDGGPGWLGWLGLLVAAPACAVACADVYPRFDAQIRRSGAFVGVLGGAAGVAFGWVAGASGSFPVAALFTLIGLVPPAVAVIWVREVRPVRGVVRPQGGFPVPGDVAGPLIDRSADQRQPTKTASGTARVPAGR